MTIFELQGMEDGKIYIYFSEGRLRMMLLKMDILAAEV